MQLVKDLWQDEYGLILSAEAVTVGTVGVLGAVVGMNMAATAVDEEMKEFAFAIRSLDQSYGYAGHQSCGAWSAGSCYRQPDVQVSLNDMRADGTTDIRGIQEHVGEQQKAHLPPASPPQADAEHTVPVAPNQIPVPAVKGDKPKSEMKAGEKNKESDKPAPKKKKKKGDKDKSDRDEV
ncbi:MAG: hypothetical protein AABP62_11025 [Planctomycetota bacterium]